MTTQQHIMVMSRHQDSPLYGDGEWGMVTSFSIDVLGIQQAVEKAFKRMNQEAAEFQDFEYKLQGGEW